LQTIQSIERPEKSTASDAMDNLYTAKVKARQLLLLDNLILSWAKEEAKEHLFLHNSSHISCTHTQCIKTAI